MKAEATLAGDLPEIFALTKRELFALTIMRALLATDAGPFMGYELLTASSVNRADVLLAELAKQKATEP